MRTLGRLALVGTTLLAGSVLAAPPAPGVALTGAVPKPMSFAQKDLQALGTVTESWTEHGTSHQVSGVPLDKVLAAAGFAPGVMGKEVPKREKRAGWKMALRVTATDGFQAVFSCAELWEGMGATRALLVWDVDGKPLGPELGPFRIVVLTDREPSRSVHNVTKLEVLDLRS
jgi:DMSO/TMAO reductase YedYZ molybdopterin-dependent catalytic subunit